MVVTRRAAILSCITLLLSVAVSCRRAAPDDIDAAELAALEVSLNALSFDLMPVLSTGSVTGVHQLKSEYKRLYTNRPPLFTAKALAADVLRASEFHLPPREYYWLPSWTSNDPPGTPLFWSYFHIPADVVDYLAIDGSEHVCSSNDFYALIVLLSNRIERANLEMPEAHRKSKIP